MANNIIKSKKKLKMQQKNSTTVVVGDVIEKSGSFYRLIEVTEGLYSYVRLGKASAGFRESKAKDALLLLDEKQNKEATKVIYEIVEDTEAKPVQYLKVVPKDIEEQKGEETIRLKKMDIFAESVVTSDDGDEEKEKEELAEDDITIIKKAYTIALKYHSSDLSYLADCTYAGISTIDELNVKIEDVSSGHPGMSLFSLEEILDSKIASKITLYLCINEIHETPNNIYRFVKFWNKLIKAVIPDKNIDDMYLDVRDLAWLYGDRIKLKTNTEDIKNDPISNNIVKCIELIVKLSDCAIRLHPSQVEQFLTGKHKELIGKIASVFKAINRL